MSANFAALPAPAMKCVCSASLPKRDVVEMIRESEFSVIARLKVSASRERMVSLSWPMVSSCGVLTLGKALTLSSVRSAVSIMDAKDIAELTS